MQDEDASHPQSLSNRWRVTLAVVALAQAFGACGVTLVYPFLPLYVQTLDGAQFINTELLAGLVIAAPPLMATLSTPFWGRLADQYGRKKMVMRATFTASVILFLMGFAQTALVLVVLRGLQGLTSGIIAANMALVAGECPRGRIGFALGALQVGLFGGVAVGPIFGGVLAENFGFQLPFLFTAIMLVLAGLLVTFGVKETYIPHKNKTLDLNPRKMMRAWADIIKARGVKTVYSLRFLNGFAQRTLMPIAPLFVLALMPTVAASGASSYAGLVLTVSSVTTTAGSLLLGWLSDKWGYRNILLGAALVAMIFYIPQAFVTDIAQLLLFQGLAGFAAGGVLAAPAALLANYTNLGDEGSVYGLDASLSSFANGLAPLTGSMIGAVLGLRAVFAAVAVYYLVILVISWQCLPKSRRQGLAMSLSAASGD